MTAIETRFHGPTTKGAHISATALETGRRIVRAYDHSLSLSDNHSRVALEMAQLAGWFEQTTSNWRGVIPGTTKRGYVWVRCFSQTPISEFPS